METKQETQETLQESFVPVSNDQAMPCAQGDKECLIRWIQSQCDCE